MKYTAHGGDIYRDGSVDWIDFSSNTNLLGMPDSVKKAIADNVDTYGKYPDPLCRELVGALADFHGLPAGHIVCGNGAADLIFRIALSLKPKRAMIVAPTFSEYEIALRTFGCGIEYHMLSEEHEFELNSDIINDITNELDILFICNPNNPTGKAAKKDLMLEILKRCAERNCVAVIDECFMDFVQDNGDYSILQHLSEFPIAIVLKAFTKTYAMAGLRLGYALCSDENIINLIRNTLQPWSVSTVASKAGVAALRDDQYIAESEIRNAQERAWLLEALYGLDELGVKALHSDCNFIFFKSKCEMLCEKLEKYGVLLRSCKNFQGLDASYYRCAVKSREENQYLISCLRIILDEE